MGEQQPTSDNAAWIKMQIDMVEAVLGDVKGLREDLSNGNANWAELGIAISLTADGLWTVPAGAWI